VSDAKPKPVSAQQPGALALGSQYGHGLLVKTDKLLGAEPMALVRSRAIGKVAARIKEFQPSLNRRAIGDDAFAVYQITDRSRHFLGCFPRALPENPGKLAKNGDGYGNQFGAAKGSGGQFACLGSSCNTSRNNTVVSATIFIAFLPRHLR